MNGFSPVRIRRCGSATGIFSTPLLLEPALTAGVAIDCRGKPSRRRIMGDFLWRSRIIFTIALAAAAVVQPTLAQSQSEPPGRVGRLAFTQGTVSFHSHDQDGWTRAAVNT